MRDEIDQKAVVGHVVLQVRMRPVRSPQRAVGEFFDQAAGEGDDVAIGVLFAVQRRRPRKRQPLGAGDLAPDVRVLAHEPEEERKFGAVDGLSDIGATHVVDDDRSRQDGEEVPEFGQIRRLEIDDDMPAEAGDAAGDLH